CCNRRLAHQAPRAGCSLSWRSVMRARLLPLTVGLLSLSVFLSGCGGGGGGSDSPSSSNGGNGPSAPTASAPAATAVTIGIGLKQLQLSWNAVAGASSYRVLEDADGSGFVQVGADLPGTQTSYAHNIAVHLQNWSAARYQVQSCNTEGCSTSAAV